ncbi:MAG: hypothetical protein ACRECY_07585, partial [Phyllobacterium sp.]
MKSLSSSLVRNVPLPRGTYKKLPFENLPVVIAGMQAYRRIAAGRQAPIFYAGKLYRLVRPDCN